MKQVAGVSERGCLLLHRLKPPGVAVPCTRIAHQAVITSPNDGPVWLYDQLDDCNDLDAYGVLQALNAQNA